MNFKIKTVFTTAFLGICLLVSAQNPADFQLKSVTDNSQFTLSQAKGKYVALHFLLKTECPFCLRLTMDYFRKASTQPDVVQVFIKPDSKEEILEWTKSLPEDMLSKIKIYRDPDANLADKFSIPGGYHFHNQIIHYPALVLLDPNGKEVFRYIGKNNTDRFSFEKLEAKIKELKKM